MKPILIIALGIGALGGGAIGAAILGVLHTPSSPTPATATPTATTEYVFTQADDDAILEIAMLRSELESLRDEVLRLSSERESAVNPVATPVAAITANTPNRDVILSVMLQEEERKDEERRLEREQREADSLDRRIGRIAETLSLSSADQATLSQIYKEERAKQTAMWTGMRDGGMDREMIREGMAEVRTWRTEQLNLSFGEDLAGQISEESGGRGWDWSGGRNSSGGGRNNNNGGGRGRGN